MIKKIIFGFAFLSCLATCMAQINPIGSYVCKTYRKVGATLVYYCPGKLSITISPFNSSYLSSSDTSCLGGFTYCWDLTFNPSDSTLNEVLSCTTCANGKIYPNDSIYFEQKQASSSVVNIFMGHKMKSATAGINEMKKIADKILLYPQPAQNLLNIVANNNEFENSEIEISNALGQTVLKLPYSNLIDVSQFLSGFYYLKIISQNKQVNYSKFIKE